MLQKMNTIWCFFVGLMVAGQAFSQAGACSYASMGAPAVDEGNQLAQYSINSVEECKMKCDQNSGCKSFAFCHETEPVIDCYLKDKALTGSEPTKAVGNCASYYKKCDNGTCVFEAVGLEKVVVDEGNDVGIAGGVSLDVCKNSCDENNNCHSFAYCPDYNKNCYQKDKILTGSEPTKTAGTCTSYYLKCSVPCDTPDGCPSNRPYCVNGYCDTNCKDNVPNKWNDGCVMCPKLAQNGLCEHHWSQHPHCFESGATPIGKVKDTCRVSCNICQAVYRLTSGSCKSVSANVCKDEADKLGNIYDSISIAGAPHGCYYHTVENKFYFNSAITDTKCSSIGRCYCTTADDDDIEYETNLEGSGIPDSNCCTKVNVDANNSSDVSVRAYSGIYNFHSTYNSRPSYSHESKNGTYLYYRVGCGAYFPGSGWVVDTDNDGDFHSKCGTYGLISYKGTSRCPTSVGQRWSRYPTTADPNIKINCAVNGVWGEWTNWEECPVTCGGADQGRTRVCDNPAPQFGGDDCTVDGSTNSETQRCNEDPCPINGGFSDWDEWGPCTVTCGGGDQTRARRCDNPAPQFGGLACEGDFTDCQRCSVDLCPSICPA